MSQTTSTSLNSLFVAFALCAVASCGPKPGVRPQSLLDAGDYRGAIAAADDEMRTGGETAPLWRIKIRAELLAGNSEGAVAHYATWRNERGQDDREALKDMAELTLWRGLATSSTELNIAAIRSVERHKLVRLADEVTDLIASDDDEVAATAAIAVLRDHPQAANVAAARLSSPNPRARAVVISGIARKIPKRAAKEIRDALEDPSPIVRRAAIGAVSVLKDRLDTAALARLARFDTEKSVRARAARALAKSPYFPDLELARVLLRDPYIGARLAALEIAAAKSDTGGRDVLRQVAREPALPLALRASVLLGKGPGWGPLYARALAAERWTTRVTALGSIPSALDRATAIDAAETASADSRVEVRLAAARLFYRLGDHGRAKSVFEKELISESPPLGAAVAVARDFADPRGVAEIAKRAKSSERASRAESIEAFVTIGRGDRAMLELALVEALADDAPALRIQAADVILSLLP